MRAPPSKAAAAGCLQSIFTALHPELERCVRGQVSQTVPSRWSNSNEVDALLGVSKLNKNLDFGSCLKFMHTHWFNYFQHFPYELRQVAQDLTQRRHNVAHQIQVPGDELNDAIADLIRLAVIIHASRRTRYYIRMCVNVMEDPSRIVVLQDSCQTESELREATPFRLHSQLPRPLLPKLKVLVRDAIESKFSRPVKMTAETVTNLAIAVSSSNSDVILLPNAPFEEYLKYALVNWRYVKILSNDTKAFEATRKVLSYHKGFLVSRDPMNIWKFNDAIDLFLQFAVFIGASRDEISELRDLLHSDEELVAETLLRESMIQASIQRYIEGMRDSRSEPEIQWSNIDELCFLLDEAFRSLFFIVEYLIRFLLCLLKILLIFGVVCACLLQ